MILIREATEDDNDALNGLQKKCPMGTSMFIGIDSSPVYFARSRRALRARHIVAERANASTYREFKYGHHVHLLKQRLSYS